MVTLTDEDVFVIDTEELEELVLVTETDELVLVID